MKAVISVGYFSVKQGHLEQLLLAAFKFLKKDTYKY